MGQTSLLLSAVVAAALAPDVPPEVPSFSLAVRCTVLTDKQLAALAGRADVWSLDCGGDVTGEGLAHLKSLPGLRSLSLRSMRVTDGALVHLKTLASLESLDLSNTKVTD